MKSSDGGDRRDGLGWLAVAFAVLAFGGLSILLIGRVVQRSDGLAQAVGLGFFTVGTAGATAALVRRRRSGA